MLNQIYQTFDSVFELEEFLRSRYQVGISNFSGISKSHAPMVNKSSARRVCTIPFFQRIRICLGFTFMLCQLFWTSALEFVELFREIQKQKTPYVNKGFFVDNTGLSLISIVVRLVWPFFWYPNIICLLIS